MQINHIAQIFTSALHNSIISKLEQEKISILGSFFSHSNPLIVIYFNESISAQIHNNSNIEFIKKQSGVFYTIKINPTEVVDDFSNCFISMAKMFI